MGFLSEKGESYAKYLVGFFSIFICISYMQLSSQVPNYELVFFNFWMVMKDFIKE